MSESELEVASGASRRSSTAALMRRNLTVVMLGALLGGVETSMINVIWQPFILSFGVSMSVLGQITSLIGWNGLLPTLVSPLGGWLADQRGRRAVMLAGSSALILAYACYAGAGLTGLGLALAPGLVLVSIGAMAKPISSAVTSESVSAERHASAYSWLTFASILPGIVAPIAGGWLALRAGYPAIFIVALGAEIIAFTTIARLLGETRRVSRKGLDWRGLANLMRRVWKPPRGMGGFFSIMAMDSFSWGMGWSLLYGILSRQYHFNPEQLGALASITNLSWAFMQLPIGRFMDRRRIKPILVLSEAMGPPLLLIWMTQSRFEIFAISMPLFAVNAAMWIPARNTYVARAAPAENRAEVFGRLAAFSGLIAFPAAYIGGFLYDRFGYGAPFLANLIGSILTLLVILIFVREPIMTPSEEVMHDPA